MPNDQLPPLYRAADVFVTCSTSETFGLTVLESLACGTPVVLPHCGVFDELWVGKFPPEWMYDEGVAGSLLGALRSAGAEASKPHLKANPISVSWQHATAELLRQYKEIIQGNLDKRQMRQTFLGAIDSLLRALIVLFISYKVVRAYTKRSFKIGHWFIDEILDILDYM